jgi:hypothetical protein
MKLHSLLLYFSICGLNIFLFLSVIFYPIIIAPLHMLIFWLSFDWLLKAKKIKSDWNRILFSAIPLIGEIVVIAVLFSENSINPSGLVKLLDSLFFFVIILFALIEFGILIRIYSKYLTRIENTIQA